MDLGDTTFKPYKIVAPEEKMVNAVVSLIFDLTTTGK